MPFDSTRPGDTETDDLLRTLIEARALIAKPEHWVKGLPPGDGTFCAGMAADLAAMRRDDLGPAVRLALSSRTLAWLQQALPIGWIGIVAYNDRPDTSHADILALYDRAIAKRREALNG